MEYIISLLKMVTLALVIVYSVHGDGADASKEDNEEHDFYVGDNVASGRATKRVVCGLTFIKTSDDDSDSATNGDKIIGGSYAMHGEIPWVAGLQVNLMDKCTAAIISEYWIITAAHCVVGLSPDREMLTVTVGDHRSCCFDKGEKIYLVAKIILFPSYLSTQLDFDIALMKIRPLQGRGIEFNNYSQPVCLPDAEDMPAFGTPLLIAGWGRDSPSKAGSSPILKKAVLPVLNHNGCRQIFSTIWSSIMCVGNRSAGTTLCIGDSGGPAVHKSNGYYTIYGVTSFGTKNCNIKYPTALSSVNAYRRWIDETIQNNSQGSELDMPQPPVWKQSTPKPQKFPSTTSSSPSSFVITFILGLWPSVIVFCICLVPL